MQTTFGSDLVVGVLDRLGIEAVALNPGASFRGIHDSLVSMEGPAPILALHEGVAVAIAHGYAKATGRPMAALVHNLVGLQHASMGIFNAFSDNAPVVILGGAGPMDTTRRRPWIDWVHTPTIQNSTVRDFTKWDAAPASLEAVPDALIRAHRIARTLPEGPTYVAIDALLQEQEVPEGFELGTVPTSVPSTFGPPLEMLERFASLLSNASRPLIIADGVGRSERAYEALILLAEELAIGVVDLGARHSFPNTHPCDVTFGREAELKAADVILVLEPRDLGYAIQSTDHVDRRSVDLVDPSARILCIGTNDLSHRGFIDREPVVRDVESAIGDVDLAVPLLLDLVRPADRAAVERRRVALAERSRALRERQAGLVSARPGEISPAVLAAATWDAVRDGPWQLAFPAFRNWARSTWHLDRFRCHLGGSGGAGLGYGPGATVGAALAHRNDDTLVVSLQPDGDLLYAPMALWTAAHHRLPLLMVVEDNASYGADRLHQTRVAMSRGRSVADAGIGIDIEDPRVDIAALGAAFGVETHLVQHPSELAPALSRGARTAREDGLPVVVHVGVSRPEL
jgi:benzoylformate decarboxylase/acetolactate synthase-1/2/3 large subunit